MWGVLWTRTSTRSGQPPRTEAAPGTRPLPWLPSLLGLGDTRGAMCLPTDGPPCHAPISSVSGCPWARRSLVLPLCWEDWDRPSQLEDDSGETDTLIVMIRTDGPGFVQTASGGKDGVEQEVSLFAREAKSWVSTAGPSCNSFCCHEAAVDLPSVFHCPLYFYQLLSPSSPPFLIIWIRCYMHNNYSAYLFLLVQLFFSHILIAPPVESPPPLLSVHVLQVELVPIPTGWSRSLGRGDWFRNGHMAQVWP